VTFKEEVQLWVCQKNRHRWLQRINLLILLRSNQNIRTTPDAVLPRAGSVCQGCMLSLKEKAPAIVLEVEASEIAFKGESSLLQHRVDDMHANKIKDHGYVRMQQ
jgi:hypothetical protein